MSKIKRSISLDEEQWNKIQNIADKKFTSASAIIRQAIHKEIEREHKTETK